MVEHPPKGYSQMQYPLPHNFSYGMALHAENELKNSVILTMFRTSENAVGVDAIEVNPRNALFAEDTGPLIHVGSIVPLLTLG